MKNSISLSIIALTVTMFMGISGSSAQKLVMGEKAPDMKVSGWISDRPAESGTAQLVEFFHSSNRQCHNRLPALDALAQKYSGKLTVIIMTKETAETVADILYPGSRSYYAAVDDGRTFGNFGVQYSLSLSAC